jgi:hypothetical protein
MTTNKKAARALFDSGKSIESIAGLLNIEPELIEAWRDEGCWCPARDLATAGRQLADGSKDSAELDDLHQFIVEAFGGVLAWLAKMQGEIELATAADSKAWSKLTRCTSKALLLKQKIEADISKSRDLRDPPFVGGPPCASPREREAGDGLPPRGLRVVGDTPGAPDDNTIIARALAFGIANFAKVMSGERPRKPAELGRVASLASQALADLLQLRKVMRGTDLKRRIDEARRGHAA